MLNSSSDRALSAIEAAAGVVIGDRQRKSEIYGYFEAVQRASHCQIVDGSEVMAMAGKK